MKNTGLVYSDIYRKHLTGSLPERKERLDAILKALKPLELTPIAPRKATLDEVMLCHTHEWVEQAKSQIDHGLPYLNNNPDLPVCLDSFEVALLAAGGALAAVDAVLENKVKNAFCLIRPPGHHATRDQGMGFCIFNNVAIATRYAMETHGIKNVLIVDWDVHHGNGTEDIFQDEPNVYYFSTHQAGIFPLTGKAKQTAHLCDIPLTGEPGVREKVLQAYLKTLPDAMRAFQPELVMISCGFDARQEDLLGGMDLTDQDFYEMTKSVCEIAKKYAKGKVISCLEGGYFLPGISLAAKAHVSALLKTP